MENIITQIIGCAYTYQGSLGIRKILTTGVKNHSSQTKNFSYFYKGDINTVVGNGKDLILRRDKGVVNSDHWSEPELALFLGERHEILGYSLANDFTAIGIEIKGRTFDFDGTYFGKVWKGSCSIGPRIIPIRKIDVNDIDIGLRIEREGKVIYDHKYNTKTRKRSFEDLPKLIIDYAKTFQEPIPLSKRIQIKNGYLESGTVILAGTGIIVPKSFYSQEGDIVTVYCDQIGELKNRIK